MFSAQTLSEAPEALLGVGGDSRLGFCSFAGLTLPCIVNMKKSSNEQCKDLFSDETELVDAVRLALQPLTDQ